MGIKYIPNIDSLAAVHILYFQGQTNIETKFPRTEIINIDLPHHRMFEADMSYEINKFIELLPPIISMNFENIDTENNIIIFDVDGVLTNEPEGDTFNVTPNIKFVDLYKRAKYPIISSAHPIFENTIRKLEILGIKIDDQITKFYDYFEITKAGICVSIKHITDKYSYLKLLSTKYMDYPHLPVILIDDRIEIINMNIPFTKAVKQYKYHHVEY